MKKLFISQPMRGKTVEEIHKVRERAIAAANRELGEPVEVIDSIIEGAPDGADPLWYLGRSIELLSSADVVFFAKGWEAARGCRVENMCAIEYGIETVIEDYTEATTEEACFDFGVAIKLMIQGIRVARKSWNGKGQCVAYQKGYPEGIPCNKNTAEAWGMKEGELFKCRPYFQLKCVDGSFQMWVPSVSDCLGNDWYIVL